ncbi:hypothetical protein [Hymenobacter gelipurpurascens]|nr:hypothetical protein [Hymenobacter gelipurpurascens]
MKNLLMIGLLVLWKVSACYGQKVPEALQYQLASTIVEDLRPISVLVPAQLPDTLGVRVYLSAHPNSYYFTQTEKFMLSGKETDQFNSLLRYFKPADILYMQQQLPAVREFKFKLGRFPQNWVHIITKDTLTPLGAQYNKRLESSEEYKRYDSLLHLYGSNRRFEIWGMLFSRDFKSAVVSVSYYDGWDIWVYKKGPNGWRREGKLYSVIE